MLYDLRTIAKWVEQLKNAVDADDPNAAAQAAKQLSSRRVARELAGVDPVFIASVLKALEEVKAGRVTGYLPESVALAVLGSLSLDDASALLSAIPPDHALGLLQDMDEDLRTGLLERMNEEDRAEWEARRDYDADSAGAAMTTEFIVVNPGTRVEDALEALASAPPEIEKSSYVYVVDDGGHPLGVASIRDLVRASRKETIDKIMIGNLLVARTNDAARDAARLLRNRRYAMLPIVNENGVLAGVLTLDDAADILARDVADQFSGIGGDRGDENFFTRPMGAVKRRLPWMAGNVFLNLIAVAVITGFEDTIAQVAILAAFLPMITDMGGNVGIQSLSVAIRSIALGEAQIRDYSKAAVKELVVGAVNGLALGILFGVIAFAMRGRLLLGLVAGTALGINVIVAGVVGGCLPFLIKRLGKDPAMMTGPLLTTITDVTGVTIYLGLSTLFIMQLAS